MNHSVILCSFLKTFWIYFESYFPIQYIIMKQEEQQFHNFGYKKKTCKRKEDLYILSKISPIINNFTIVEY